jgi:predicted CoA-substrate-specific enzyme activase
MHLLGIDVGSLTTKAVVLGDDGIISYSITESGDEAEQSATAAMDQALRSAGLGVDDVAYIVTTGAGGKTVSFSRQHKSVNTCLARGIFHLFPEVRTVIDMGAESSGVLKLNARGRLTDWESQDKCASGTGIFLQQMSKLMRMSLEEMSDLSFEAKARAEVSNTCAVFAESEVISHVHRQPPTPPADLVAGIYASMVSRVMVMCKRIGIEREVAVVGGVALNKGLINIVGQELGFEAVVPEVPQIVAALGAAVIARENVEKESPG